MAREPIDMDVLQNDLRLMLDLVNDPHPRLSTWRTAFYELGAKITSNFADIAALQALFDSKSVIDQEWVATIEDLKRRIAKLENSPAAADWWSPDIQMERHPFERFLRGFERPYRPSCNCQRCGAAEKHPIHASQTAEAKP